MTITNGYCTLNELKADLPNAAASADDTALEDKIEAASRMIDEYCGRRFYTASETRYYTAEWADLLMVDDLVSVSSLTTDEDGDRTYETTWQTTDYDLEPYNASLTSKPYTEIHTSPNGNNAFPTTRKGVKIVGSFGWPAVPEPIKTACIIQASRLFRRRDAVFGIAGSAEMGQQLVIPKLDPDVIKLLEPYVRVQVYG